MVGVFHVPRTALLCVATILLGEISLVASEVLPPPTYEEWMQRHAQWRAQHEFFKIDGTKLVAEVQDVLLYVTSVEHDEWARLHPNLPITPTYRGFILSTAGEMSFFRIHSAAAQGGDGVPALTADEQAQVRSCLASLPDDESRLPPPERRVIVEHSVAGRVQRRVYDRANLPDVVLQILRLIRSEIRPWVLSFPPTNEFQNLPPVNTTLYDILSSWIERSPVVVKRLRIDGEIPQRIAYSPDETWAAVAARSPNAKMGEGLRLRICREATGQIVHELRPYELAFGEAMEGLLWTPDGRYVIAAAKSDRFEVGHTTGIWSLADGRQRGELSRIGRSVAAMMLSPDGRNLTVRDADGLHQVWDLKLVLERIDDFERSLVAQE